MRALPPAETGNPLPYLIQGEEFLRPSVRAMQADDFDNPALPLVEAAEASWSTPATPGGKSCEDCHGGGDKNLLKRVAAAYPKYVPDLKEVITLQTRINNCRKIHLGEPAIAEEDSRMIGMTAYLRWLARGAPSAVDITGPNAEVFERGRRLYQTKLGRFQISCAQCHNEKFGQKFGADTLSQGHPLAYPAFKSSEGRVISLHERFRMCNKFARAEGQPDSAPDYVALELYLNWRSKSLPITAPGVRP
ncbi:MAG: sulfur oxidation c-type cytochrome SoxA [Rhodomicrobium sp.]